jgi:hypothetical protein
MGLFVGHHSPEDRPGNGIGLGAGGSLVVARKLNFQRRAGFGLGNVSRPAAGVI